MKETLLEQRAKKWRLRDMPVHIVWTDCERIVFSRSIRKQYFEIRANVIYRHAPEAICQAVFDFFGAEGKVAKEARERMREWRTKAYRGKRRRKTPELIDEIPGGGARLLKNWRSGLSYFEGRDVIRKRETRVYTNMRGTHLSRSRDKLPQEIMEFKGSNLSEPWIADDDPEDWGRPFDLSITRYYVNSRGMISSEVIFEEGSNVRMYPWDSDAFSGYGPAVNILVDSWGVW